MALRFNIEARDVPPKEAAKRIGTSLEDFNAKLPKLIDRGFPRPDPDTGNFDLHAIDRWCDARHGHLFGTGSTVQARDAGDVFKDRIGRIVPVRAGR